MTDAPAIEANAVEGGDTLLVPGKDGGTAIVGALITAMEKVGTVGKEKLHAGEKTGKWNYRSADDVVNAVHPALIEANVLAVPTVLKHSRNGSVLELELRYTLISAEDGSRIIVDVVSHGMGNTAYTTGAAMSYGLKYALSQLFMIPFDDDKLDLESNAHGETWQGAVRGHEQSGPGRFVTDDDVAMLLRLVTDEGDDFRARFKGKQAEVGSNDYTWSLNDKHKWTYIEWREAMSWVLAHRGQPAEPFNGHDGETEPEASQSTAEPEPEPEPETPAPDPDAAPVEGWEPPGPGVWTKHGKANGVTMRRLFLTINEGHAEEDHIADIKALCALPTLAKEWWDWIGEEGKQAAKS